MVNSRAINYIAKLDFYTEAPTPRAGTSKHSGLKMAHTPEHTSDERTFDIAGKPGATHVPDAEGLSEPPEAEMGIQ